MLYVLSCMLLCVFARNVLTCIALNVFVWVPFVVFCMLRIVFLGTCRIEYFLFCICCFGGHVCVCILGVFVLCALY